VAWANGNAFNVSLAKLQPGDTLIVPNKTFHLVGGIIAKDVRDATISFDGTLVYAFEDTVEAAERYIKSWPRRTKGSKGKEGAVLECMEFTNFTNVTFTSGASATSKCKGTTCLGTFEGRGQKWWGIPGLGYLKREENRPRELSTHHAAAIGLHLARALAGASRAALTSVLTARAPLTGRYFQRERQGFVVREPLLSRVPVLDTQL
jgi:hypothetical protein